MSLLNTKFYQKLSMWVLYKFLNLDKKVEKRALRRKVADKYLEGDGIEIGALLFPLGVPKKARVSYVDRMSVEDLKKEYAEFKDQNLVPVDHIDDGETLSTFKDGSQDFVIANHVIEHMENPLSAIENWLRVLKPDGTLYLALPDKRDTFDKDRPLTSLEHALKDYKESPSTSRMDHFMEWSKFVAIKVYKFSEDKIKEEAKKLEKEDYSIHYHVWTPVSFIELLSHCNQELKFNFDIEFLQKYNHEMIFVLRKLAKN